MTQADALAEKVRNLPREPGIYKFKDAAGKTLYVGKASSLRSRVGSYFQAPESRGGKTAVLVSQIVDGPDISNEAKQAIRVWRSNRRVGSAEMDDLAEAVNETLGTVLDERTTKLLRRRGQYVSTKDELRL